MLSKLKSIAKNLEKEIRLYKLILKHERTPKLPKILLGLAVGYTLLPFDIVPDFIPIIGHVDDFIIVPFLIIISLKLIPKDVINECRREINNEKI